MYDNLTLRNQTCTVELASQGAELMSWRIADRELIWSGDARWWPRRAPVLFPICGWTNGNVLRVDGAEFPCDVHSFGREAKFGLQQTGDASARFHLKDSDWSRAQFPFAFDLTIDVTLSESGLSYAFAVVNPGPRSLPFAIGFHPGFVWPFDGGRKEDYRIEFAQKETATAPVIAPGGLFTDATMPLPLDGRRLDIAAALALQEAQAILNANSAEVAFVAPSGRRIRVSSDGFPHWVLWSRPGGAYLCIERWTGQGDPVGFTGDITEKPGQMLLTPGGRWQGHFGCEFL